MGKMGKIVAANNAKEVKKPTVGDEFVEWAEKYWGLKDKYVTKTSTENEEACPFNYVKETFANKIDEIIKERLEGK